MDDPSPSWKLPLPKPSQKKDFFKNPESRILPFFPWALISWHRIRWKFQSPRCSRPEDASQGPDAQHSSWRVPLRLLDKSNGSAIWISQQCSVRLEEVNATVRINVSWDRLRSESEHQNRNRNSSGFALRHMDWSKRTILAEILRFVAGLAEAHLQWHLRPKRRWGFQIYLEHYPLARRKHRECKMWLSQWCLKNWTSA